MASRVYRPKLRRHVSPERIASCINNAFILYTTHGVSEPVKVGMRTADGLVTMLVSFGLLARSQPTSPVTGAGSARDSFDYKVKARAKTTSTTTNTASCIRRKPSGARRHPQRSPSAVGPRCSLMS